MILHACEFACVAGFTSLWVQFYNFQVNTPRLNIIGLKSLIPPVTSVSIAVIFISILKGFCVPVLRIVIKHLQICNL
jgi:hypothetical protein